MCRRLVVDVRRDPGPPAELREPLPLLRSEDGVGDGDVDGPRRDEHLGFGDLRHGEAGGPRRELERRDFGGLVGLCVRPETDAVRGDRILLASDVSLESIDVDHEAGGRELVERLTWLDHVAGLRSRKAVHRRSAFTSTNASESSGSAGSPLTSHSTAIVSVSPNDRAIATQVQPVRR